MEKIDFIAVGLGNNWFSSGWNFLVDQYREYQGYVMNDPTDTGRSRGRFLVAQEMLARQLAYTLHLPVDQVEYQLYDRLAQICGTPEKPLDWDRWADR